MTRAAAASGPAANKDSERLAIVPPSSAPGREKVGMDVPGPPDPRRQLGDASSAAAGVAPPQYTQHTPCPGAHGPGVFRRAPGSGQVAGGQADEEDGQDEEGEVLRPHTALLRRRSGFASRLDLCTDIGGACTEGARVPRTHPALGSTPIAS